MAQQTTEPTKKPAHRHPNSERYLNTCKGCRAADAERSALDKRSVSEDDLERTTFLIPETGYDNAVCRAYLSHKYPDARYIGSTIDLAKLGGWPLGDRIVVIRRDTWPKAPGVGQRREKDEENKWVYIDIPPETYIAECVESEPIDVHATMVTTKGDRFTQGAMDWRPLIARLCEQMCLPYRIDMPRDEKDTVARFVHA